jgi:secreted trypsin-like serine protease
VRTFFDPFLLFHGHIHNYHFIVCTKVSINMWNIISTAIHLLLSLENTGDSVWGVIVTVLSRHKKLEKKSIFLHDLNVAFVSAAICES